MPTTPSSDPGEPEALHDRLDASGLWPARARQLATIAERVNVQSAAITLTRARQMSPMRRLLCLAAGGSEPPVHEMPPRAALGAKVVSGDLRRDHCRHVVVTTGRGECCQGCDMPIAPEHVELRARFDDGGLLRFHARCFSSWFNETQSS